MLHGVIFVGHNLIVLSIFDASTRKTTTKLKLDLNFFILERTFTNWTKYFTSGHTGKSSLETHKVASSLNNKMDVQNVRRTLSFHDSPLL